MTATGRPLSVTIQVSQRSFGLRDFKRAWCPQRRPAEAPPSPALGSLGSEGSLGSDGSEVRKAQGPGIPFSALCAFAVFSGTETSETDSGSLLSTFLASRFCLAMHAAAPCVDPATLLPRAGVRAFAVLWMLALPPPLSQTPVPAHISCPTHSALRTPPADCRASPVLIQSQHELLEEGPNLCILSAGGSCERMPRLFCVCVCVGLRACIRTSWR